MSLEEKVGQVIQGELRTVTAEDIRRYHLGSVLNGGGSTPLTVRLTAGEPVTVTHRWSGQVIETADGLPFIGRNSGSDHVYVATGYAGNGMTFGTLLTLFVAFILGQALAWTYALTHSGLSYSRSFVQSLVLIAVVVAAPAAYLVIDRWLGDFAYRIEISWPIFLISGLTALLVALLTVSYHATRAALANPIDSLRYE